MKTKRINFNRFALFTWVLLILFLPFSVTLIGQTKVTSGGELTFTIRTVTAGGNYSPKHVLAIWVEDADGFVKTRKAMANQRKQYLYTWKAASNYNVVDAITGSTLTSHQTHTVMWDCTDLDGEIVPDGDYVVWAEFTDKHAQGPLYNITFTKGPDAQSMSPADETYFKDIELEFTPLVADFSTDATNICQLESVTFTDESVNASSYEWNFGESADPASSTTQGPHTVTYTTAGSKTVTLTINGSLTETKENLISVTQNPVADFTFAGMDLTVDFTNNSLDATTYLWDFGDGNTSPDSDPSHTYAAAGNYTVVLIATNFECEDQSIQEVMVPLTGIINTTAYSKFDVFPNPNNGEFKILFNKKHTPESIRVMDQSGRTVLTLNAFDSEVSTIPIDLVSTESGIYYLVIISEGETMSKKIIIK